MCRPLTLHRAPLCPPWVVIVPVDKAVIQHILTQGRELETEDGSRPSISLAFPSLCLSLCREPMTRQRPKSKGSSTQCTHSASQEFQRPFYFWPHQQEFHKAEISSIISWVEGWPIYQGPGPGRRRQQTKERGAGSQTKGHLTLPHHTAMPGYKKKKSHFILSMAHLSCTVKHQITRCWLPTVLPAPLYPTMPPETPEACHQKPL